MQKYIYMFCSLVIAGFFSLLGYASVAPPSSQTSTNVSANAAFLPEDGPSEGDYPALHNLLQITEELYSGGEPHTEESFASLVRLGIKTVVSVDGATPDVALARKYGLRYVHIPIGYDGIDEAAGLSFARLAQDAKGPLYVHCHHGKHRGPAAAAITCIAMGKTNNAGALAILKRAGSSENYGRLWRDVENYQMPTADVALPDLVEVATINSLAAAMAQIDRAYDHLVLYKDAGWTTPPDHTDLVPAQEALLIREAFRESVRNLDVAYDAQFTVWLTEAELQAESLETAISAKDTAVIAKKFAALRASCMQCHKAYRN